MSLEDKDRQPLVSADASSPKSTVLRVGVI